MLRSTTKMEEIEPPTEHLHEELHHSAQHSPERWISWVALSSALLAVFAAVSALLAGHHVDEAMLARIQASDQWSYYQAKGVKANLLATKTELLAALGHKAAEKDGGKLRQYQEEQKDIAEKARALEEESNKHLERHARLARGVTLFQIAIAVGAIAALSKQKSFWHVSLVFGAIGLFFLIQSCLVR